MPAPIAPLRISAYTVTTAAGPGKAALHAALRDGRSALSANDFGPTPLATWIGRVAGVEAAPLPAPLAAWECRNNRLAWLGLNGDAFIDAVHAARERHGAARVAVVLGTSTSSIGATEDAYRHLDAAASSRPATATRSSTRRIRSPTSSTKRSTSKGRASRCRRRARRARRCSRRRSGCSGSASSMPPSSAASTRSAAASCSASTRSSSSRPSRAGRSTPIAAASASARQRLRACRAHG